MKYWNCNWMKHNVNRVNWISFKALNGVIQSHSKQFCSNSTQRVYTYLQNLLKICSKVTQLKWMLFHTQELSECNACRTTNPSWTTTHTITIFQNEVHQSTHKLHLYKFELNSSKSLTSMCIDISWSCVEILPTTITHVCIFWLIWVYLWYVIKCLMTPVTKPLISPNITNYNLCIEQVEGREWFQVAMSATSTARSLACCTIVVLFYFFSAINQCITQLGFFIFQTQFTVCNFINFWASGVILKFWIHYWFSAQTRTARFRPGGYCTVQ